MAIVEHAARSAEPLDAAAAERVNRAAVAIANLNPLPRLSLETIRALDLIHRDAATTVYPAVSSSEILAELDSMLAGTSSSWGDTQRANIWLIRFASLAASQGTLSRAAGEHLIASDDPWVRAAAIEIAASHDLIDRSRLRALIRDPDPDVRTVALSRFVETTPPGDETAALDEVRAWLNSDRDDPSEAAAMLPALGPGGAAIAEDAVRRGGLSDSHLAPAFASLILNRRLDAVPIDATHGDVGGALVGWLEGARSTHEGADSAIAAFLRRSSVPADESLMDRWFELAVDAGEVQWLEVIARDRSQRAFVRAHALDRYIGELLAAGATAFPACVVELVKDRTDDPAFRRMLLADVLDTNHDRAFACDPDLLAAVRDIAATDKNPHVRRAARDALESAERSLDSNK